MAGTRNEGYNWFNLPEGRKRWQRQVERGAGGRPGGTVYIGVESQVVVGTSSQGYRGQAKYYQWWELSGSKDR